MTPEHVLLEIQAVCDQLALRPDDDALSEQICALEIEVGPTMSAALAAKLLGISADMVQHRIDDGRLATVLSRSGYSELPTGMLLGLRERQIAEIRSGAAALNALDAVLRQDAERAADLDPVALIAGNWDVWDGDGNHGRSVRRARAYHAAVAHRLTSADVSQACRTLRRWRHGQMLHEYWALAWDGVLSQPVDEIAATIVARGQDADDLRQNSPFAGVLSEPERRKILTSIT